MEDDFLLVLTALISGLISSFLVNHPVFDFFLLVISGLLVYSYVVGKIKESQILNRVMYATIAFLISLLATVVFASIYPYLLLGESYLDSIVLLWLYLVPVFAVCLVSFELIYSNIFSRKKVSFVKQILYAIALVIIISSVSVVFLNISDARSIRRSNNAKTFDIVIEEMQNASAICCDDIEILGELKGEANALIKRAQELKDYERKNICLQDECYLAPEISFNKTVLVVQYIVLGGYLMQVKEILANYSTGQLDLDIDYLAKMNTLNYTYIDNTPDELELLRSIDDPRYSELNSPSLGAGVWSAWNQGNLFEHESVFFNSLAYIVKHTKYFRNIQLLVIKVDVYTSKEGRNRTLIAKIFESRKPDESDLSKALRYLLVEREVLRIANRKAQD